MDKKMRIIDVASGKIERVVEHRTPVQSVTFDRQGNQMATTSLGGELKIFDDASGESECEVQHVRAIAFDLKGTQIATGCDADQGPNGEARHRLRIVDEEGRQKIETFDWGQVSCCCFDSEGKR